MSPCFPLPQPAVAAVISVIEPRRDRQSHWLLPCGGYPQAIASLLAAPLCSTGQPARRWREWLAVFAPLSPLLNTEPQINQPDPLYRYLLCLPAGRPTSTRISCWRRYPDGLGWQRRCGPMPLGAFIQRFGIEHVGIERDSRSVQLPQPRLQPQRDIHHRHQNRHLDQWTDHPKDQRRLADLPG
jgi:hypothetical protein